MRTIVEVAPGGTLGDYVPFYFGPRSPMLFTYSKGNVPGTSGNQDEIIYFVTEAEYLASKGYEIVFTDGHPITEPKAFFNDLKDIDEVDLALMKSKYWSDTDADPDRKRRRQAEFLVRGKLAWEDISGIAVRTPAMHAWVEEALRDTPYTPPCILKPTWYYN